MNARGLRRVEQMRRKEQHVVETIDIARDLGPVFDKLHTLTRKLRKSRKPPTKAQSQKLINLILNNRGLIAAYLYQQMANDMDLTSMLKLTDVLEAVELEKFKVNKDKKKRKVKPALKVGLPEIREST
jgi:hypothetical protein